MSPLDHYLSRVARQLRDYPAFVTQNELRELRSHLEQLVHDGVAQGLTHDDATRAAISQFGDARSVGNKLVDVWDGREIGLARICIALSCVVIFWLRAYFPWAYASAIYSFWSLKPLFPEIPYLLAGWLAGIGFTTGFIFSVWLGRRSWIINLAFSLLSIPLFEFIFGLPYFRFYFGYLEFHPNFNLILFQLIFSSAGIWLTNFWQARFRFSQFEASGNVFIRRDAFFPNWKNIAWERVQLVIIWGLTISLALAGGAKFRFDSVFHPHSAIQAVRVKLLTVRSSEFPLPRIIELKELETSTPNRARRVKFKIIVSESEELRRVQLEGWEKQLHQFPRMISAASVVALRASLKRIRANAFEIHGIAVVRNSSAGWQVDDSSFDFNRLTNWSSDPYSQH